MSLVICINSIPLGFRVVFRIYLWFRCVFLTDSLDEAFECTFICKGGVMGKGRWIREIVDIGILNKQCRIYKPCTLIVLVGSVFSQRVFQVLYCVCVLKQIRQNTNEIKLRRKTDELFVLSPSGYIFIYICVVIEVCLQLFWHFSVFPKIFLVIWSFNECYTAAFPLSPSEIH